MSTQVYCPLCKQRQHAPKTSALRARNEELYRRYKAGDAMSVLCHEYDLTRQRIHQILNQRERGCTMPLRNLSREAVCDALQRASSTVELQELLGIAYHPSALIPRFGLHEEYAQWKRKKIAARKVGALAQARACYLEYAARLGYLPSATWVRINDSALYGRVTSYGGWRRFFQTSGFAPKRAIYGSFTRSKV